MSDTPTTSVERFAGNAHAFPVLGQRLFFNHAAVAPISQAAADAVVRYAQQAAETAGTGAGWYRQIEDLRTLAASFINASREEIALVKNTSEGLGIVASGINWRSGDRIVTTEVEYPANVYPWLDAAERHGLEVVRTPERIRDDGTRVIDIEEVLAAASTSNTRLVTLSHVEFGSGFRNDIAAIGEFCRSRGILFCVDAIQSLGALPVDVQAMHIDYLSADGHKWLLSPEGAGIFYCRRELIEKTHPPLVGWLSVQHPHDFDRIDFRLRGDAARFECGTWNVPGFLGLKASLEVLAEVGAAALSRRIRELTDSLVAGLSNRGYRVVSSRREGEWSGIVSALPREGEATGIQKRLLREHNVEVAVRAGRLRFSPHFYNTLEQVEQLLGLLP